MVKRKDEIKIVSNFENLAAAIQQTNDHCLKQTQRQVNTALTLRNWIIGYYIVEYEQHGDDKAEYGEQLFKKLAERLKNAEITAFPLLLYT